MMPLNLADIGEINTIQRIGGTPEVKKHLENLLLFEQMTWVEIRCPALTIH